MFSPRNTADGSAMYHKVLLMAPHGWGKTTQAKHMQERYGPGFILSGEGGLMSIAKSGLDYLPFTSFDDKSDEANGQYSFRDLFKWLRTQDFRDRGYKWIMIDSLTELSDLIMKSSSRDAEATAAAEGKKVNGFEVYTQHNAWLIGACKAIRDLQMHVIMTSLVKSGEDENGNATHAPMVGGKQSQQQLPGVFDHVFCGIRTAGKTEAVEARKVHRYVVTDEVKGWPGKTRDENGRLKPVERTGNITDLLHRLEMSDDEYNRVKAAAATQTSQTTTKTETEEA